MERIFEAADQTSRLLFEDGLKNMDFSWIFSKGGTAAFVVTGVIALLMISIIPLAGISGYSFHIFSAALQEKLSASISQTLSMINLNMVSEIEKYQYLCGSICISEEIKKGLLKKDMTDMEKNQAMLEIQNMIRNKIIYPAQAKYYCL